MSEFNFAENDQINAFAHELGIILRRIARQDESVAIGELPTPIESSSTIHFLELKTNLVEVESE
jgi:hypothetical protein